MEGFSICLGVFSSLYIPTSYFLFHCHSSSHKEAAINLYIYTGAGTEGCWQPCDPLADNSNKLDWIQHCTENLDSQNLPLGTYKLSTMANTSFPEQNKVPRLPVWDMARMRCSRTSENIHPLQKHIQTLILSGNYPDLVHINQETAYSLPQLRLYRIRMSPVLTQDIQRCSSALVRSVVP